MVQIPAGKFWMGRAYTIYADSADLVPRDKMDDRPANNIYLDAFYIDKYEVTNADYAQFIQATGAKAPWHWPEGKIPDGEEKLPVYNVNWFEATAITASGRANVCPPKRNGKKRREADSKPKFIPGATTMSIPANSDGSRRHRAQPKAAKGRPKPLVVER